MFKGAAGVEYQHVPYRGGGIGQNRPAVRTSADDDRDHAERLWLGEGSQAERLAVTTAKRWPLAPEIPTLAETVLPGFEVRARDGLWAPRGTPKEVIATWNAAWRTAWPPIRLSERFARRLGRTVADNTG